MSTTTRPIADAAWPASLRWAWEFLPHFFTDWPSDFHAALLRTLEDSQRRLIACVAPRGHAKSTTAALAYPLWSICNQRYRNIIIVTNEATLATQFVRDIRDELLTNDQILAAYGDLLAEPATTATKPRRRTRPKFAEAIFQTTTGVTVQARGTGASFRGTRVGPHRPDLIICDDLEKDLDVQSPTQRKKLEHWLRRVAMPALAPHGRLLVLGTLLHHDALLANLANRGRFPRWEYLFFRALEHEQRADGQWFPVPLWPARWSLAKLEEERDRIGTLAFEQEYLGNPIDENVRPFREEWLQRYDPRDLAHKQLVNLIAVDPAAGKEQRDYFALWVGSVDLATGIIYTREISLERINVVEQVNRILRAADRWQPLRIAIETNGYQYALKDILDHTARQTRRYLSFVPVNTTIGKRGKIEGLAPFLENGTFRLPPDCPDEVIRQFLHFPAAGHDDAPDVCAMGLDLARTLVTAGALDLTTAAHNPFARNGAW